MEFDPRIAAFLTSAQEHLRRNQRHVPIVPKCLPGYNHAARSKLIAQRSFDGGAFATGISSLFGEGFPHIMRVGIGHDTHRLTTGGPLRLGGIDIPHDHHTLGHSDADVLLHAITDALLGAASLGDIGELFPDTDEANRGRNSAQMLQVALERVTQAGFRLVNIDCIVFLQRPKLTPHKLVMRDRIAEILKLSPARVGLKAKTGEMVGIVGREEAICAQVVALIEEIGRSAPT